MPELQALPDHFTMVDLLRMRRGSFVSDVGESGGRSRNARRARELAPRLRRAGYRLVGRRAIVDDNGHPTTTSIWGR